MLRTNSKGTDPITTRATEEKQVMIVTSIETNTTYDDKT